MLREPKFPMPSLWNSLLLYSKNNNDEVYKHTFKTINSILKGGIYDHLGGGISRYSVDKNGKYLTLKKCYMTTVYLLSFYQISIKFQKR